MKKLSKGQQLKQVQREFDELKLAIKRYVEGAQREVVALREEKCAAAGAIRPIPRSAD